jgi:hypothetical protein
MAQLGVTVFRDDSDPSVLGSARAEASVYLGASGDLRAGTHTLESYGISSNDAGPHNRAPQQQPPPRRCMLSHSALRSAATAAARDVGTGCHLFTIPVAVEGTCRCEFISPGRTYDTPLVMLKHVPYLRSPYMDAMISRATVTPYCGLYFKAGSQTIPYAGHRLIRLPVHLPCNPFNILQQN